MLHKHLRVKVHHIMLFKIYRRIGERVLNLMRWTLSTLLYSINSVIFITFLVPIILWLSVFSYGCFYYAYIPVVSFSTPVYFQFSVCEDGSGKCSFPSANISLYNNGQSVIFVSGQSYHVILEMDVPDSPVNQNLGMFMVKMVLYDRQGQEVRVSSRSAILQYRSELLRILETFVFSPFLLTGYAKQKQIISVELFSDYVDDAYRPAVIVLIEVRNMRVEIYSAELKVLAEFTGLSMKHVLRLVGINVRHIRLASSIGGKSYLRGSNCIVDIFFEYLIYHWSITAAVVGIGFNVMVFFFITVLSWLGLRKRKITATTRDGDAFRTDRQASLRRERVTRTETLGPNTIHSSLPREVEETLLLTPVNFPTVEESFRNRPPNLQENVT